MKNSKMTQNKTEIKDNSPVKDIKPTEKIKKIRCYHCNRKLKLMEQIQCQCNHYFCPQHMNRHSHNCSFNMKQTIKNEIEKKNPKIHVKMTDKL